MTLYSQNTFRPKHDDRSEEDWIPETWPDLMIMIKNNPEICSIFNTKLTVKNAVLKHILIET